MTALARMLPLPGSGSRAVRVLERNGLVVRRTWRVLLSGFFEPVFYLLGIGFGLGTLVGDIGDIPYSAFVAPGLMATAAMNGALYESTFNLFFKLRYAKTYDAILSTPLGPPDVAAGEVAWALIRGALYAGAFLVVMLLLGLILSPWAILALPGALLIGLAAAAVGTAVTTFMKKWQDFDLVSLVTMPLFLFSATFYPLDVYPPAIQPLIRLSPLYHGTEMLRAFSLGIFDWSLAGHIAFLLVMGLLGALVAARRLDGLLRK